MGIESTILDLSGARPRLLRPSAITAAEIEADPGGYALDALHVDHLLIEAPPAETVWQVVRGRLARAAQAGHDQKAAHA